MIKTLKSNKTKIQKFKKKSKQNKKKEEIKKQR